MHIVCLSRLNLAPDLGLVSVGGSLFAQKGGHARRPSFEKRRSSNSSLTAVELGIREPRDAFGMGEALYTVLWRLRNVPSVEIPGMSMAVLEGSGTNALGGDGDIFGAIHARCGEDGSGAVWSKFGDRITRFARYVQIAS